MTRLLTLSILLLTAVALCDERETIRDVTGKVVGTATTSGNRTVYRDATGKTTGTATETGNRTIKAAWMSYCIKEHREVNWVDELPAVPKGLLSIPSNI